MTNASMLRILAHATPTPTSRSKGQKSKSRGGGILWRSPSRTACFVLHYPIAAISFLSHFVSLLISLLHIHRLSFMAVHVHNHHFIPSLTPSFFTLGSKPTFLTSLSHHRLLVPWIAFSDLDCFSDLLAHRFVLFSYHYYLRQRRR